MHLSMDSKPCVYIQSDACVTLSTDAYGVLSIGILKLQASALHTNTTGGKL